MIAPAKALRRPFAFIARKRKTVLKIVAVAFAIALSWVPAVFINDLSGYATGLFVTLGVLLSGAYLLLLRRGLDYAQASRVQGCTRGQQTDFVLRLKNKTVFVYPRIEVVFYQSDLFGGEGRTTSAEVMLAPRATHDVMFSMKFDHIGTYEAGLKRIVLHDLIGLFSVTFDNEESIAIEVMPQTHPLASVSFSSEAPSQSTKATKTVLNEGLDYAYVREYRWGDAIKSIHWKISARFKDYMTRIYEINANPGLVTVVDLNTPDAEPEVIMGLYDTVVESALSVSAYARRQGMESALEFMDDIGEERRYDGRMEDEGKRRLMRLLREDTSSYVGNAQTLILREVNSPYGQSNIALCTSNLDQGLVEALLEVKLRHKNPILFLAIPRGLEREEERERLAPLRRLDAAQIECFVLRSADELDAKGGLAVAS